MMHVHAPGLKGAIEVLKRIYPKIVNQKSVLKMVLLYFLLETYRSKKQVKNFHLVPER